MLMLSSLVFLGLPSLAFWCVALLFCIPVPDILDSNLDPEAGHSDIFHGFPWFIQANAERLPERRPRLLPSTSFPIHLLYRYIVIAALK